MSYNSIYIPPNKFDSITTSYFDPSYYRSLELLQWRNFYHWLRENEGGYPMNENIIFQRYYEFLEKQGLIKPISVMPGVVWTPITGYIPAY